MTQEQFIMAAQAAIPIASIFYIPRDKYRLALVSFFTFQTITWAGSLVLIQLGMFEYPVREFTRATQGSFTHLFVFTPMLFTWFILIFPAHASLARRMVHYFLFVSIISWFIYYTARYTNLQKFANPSMLLQMIAMYARFSLYAFLCRIFVSWFAKRSGIST